MPYVHPDRRMNRGGSVADYDDDLPVMHAAGVRAVVCLLNIPTDAPVFEFAGFEFLCLPVPDGGVPSWDQAEQFVQFVNAQLAAGKPVAVHCEAGLGRTGTMLALFLIFRGATAKDAIQCVRNVERVAIETASQIRFLEEYATRRQSF